MTTNEPRKLFKWPEQKFLDSLTNDEYNKLCQKYMTQMDKNFSSETKSIPHRKTRKEREKEKNIYNEEILKWMKEHKTTKFMRLNEDDKQRSGDVMTLAEIKEVERLKRIFTTPPPKIDVIQFLMKNFMTPPEKDILPPPPEIAILKEYDLPMYWLNTYH